MWVTLPRSWRKRVFRIAWVEPVELGLTNMMGQFPPWILGPQTVNWVQRLPMEGSQPFIQILKFFGFVRNCLKLIKRSQKRNFSIPKNHKEGCKGYYSERIRRLECCNIPFSNALTVETAVVFTFKYTNTAKVAMNSRLLLIKVFEKAFAATEHWVRRSIILYEELGRDARVAE